MQLYLAPMEALTGYVYRNAYMKCFHNIDRYFTPFVSGSRLGTKGRNEMMKEHNLGMEVIPQILTNRADEFVEMATYLHDEYGYEMVNLNLGCPSGTVVPKHRGAGFLAVLDELNVFLEDIYRRCPVSISIKTRIGIENTCEWERIIGIYNQYPLEELIVHPRLQKEFYSGTPHLEVFREITETSVHKLCYNGDVNSVADYHNICQMFPGIDRIMIGRGILKNPGLVGQIHGEPSVTIELLRTFHDLIFEGYQQAISGERNTLFKMKELWGFMIKAFANSDKHLKKINKSEKFVDYEIAVNMVFQQLELVI